MLVGYYIYYYWCTLKLIYLYYWVTWGYDIIYGLFILLLFYIYCYKYKFIFYYIILL